MDQGLSSSFSEMLTGNTISTLMIGMTKMVMGFLIRRTEVTES